MAGASLCAMNDHDHRALLELQRAARQFLDQLNAMFPPEEAAMILRAMAESVQGRESASDRHSHSH